MDELNEQRQQRIKKLDLLRAAGVAPYGTRFEVKDRAGHLFRLHGEKSKETLEQEKISCTLAGRVVALRRFGKAGFAVLQDGSDRLQVYLKKDLLSEQAYTVVEQLDLGDWIGVTGTLFRTKTNEFTVEVQHVTFLSKALRPLPEKWHGLTDVETRYRQRYVDLIANPQVHEIFAARSRIIAGIRSFLIERGFLEVETPMMHPIPGGAAAKPFVTHHNALGVDLYLRIAPELYLKRLIVGGFPRVFEINRNFRNEGISTIHNPEFTMLEFYISYADYQDLIALTEELISSLAHQVLGKTVIQYQGKEIVLTPPWRRWSYHQAILEVNRLDPSVLHDRDKALAAAKQLNIQVDPKSSLFAILNEIFEETVEPNLQQPTFITDYPIEISPLARRKDTDSALTDRFELYIAGREIANAFSELNDPLDQRERFEGQAAQREAGDEEAHLVDEDFLRALEFGMPPTAGEGIGIDRLIMLLTDQASIRDVVLFPPAPTGEIVRVALPFEIFVGLRYLRAKRRNRTISLNTFVSIAGITLGVAALIGTVGIMTGFREDIQHKILGTTAHIIVQERMKENMTDYDRLTDKIQTVPEVVAATPFVLRQVLLTTPSGVQGIVLRGIDPKREANVTELGKNITAGQLSDLLTPVKVMQAPADDPQAEPRAVEKPGIILGKELALRLGVFVGDTVNVVSPVGPISAMGMVPKIRTFAVVALFHSGMYEYDSSLAYIELGEAQKFFNMAASVTGVEVKVTDVFRAADIARNIEQELGFSHGARDWMQMNRNLFSALKLEKTMMFLLLVLITIVASFNIVSTLTMIVTEKQKEIAILKAMGATKQSIRRIFMLNGLIIGFTGTGIGIPLGYAFLWLIQTFWTFDPSVYYISTIPVHVLAEDVLLVAGSAILISFAATVHPANQAAKLEPVAALRYE